MQQIVQVGTHGISRSGLRPDYDEFAPRVGVAWTPMDKLVVRGGYGIYYDSGMLVVNSSLYLNPRTSICNWRFQRRPRCRA